MTNPNPSHVGLWSKQTISTLLRHIWRQHIMLVSLIAMGLGLLVLLAWPLFWEVQHCGPSFQVKTQDQLVQDHFDTLQLAVHKPLSIQFNSSGGAQFKACCLDFGDGRVDTIELSQKPLLSHSYEMAGTYMVSLLIWPENLQERPQKQLLAQLEVDCPGGLLVDYTADITQVDDTFSVQYTSRVTGAPEGELTYLWKFGDGTISTQASPVHRYALAGEYAVSLSVTRFLTTPYNCGDTAYQAGQLVLGSNVSRKMGLYPVPLSSGAPGEIQLSVQMKGWFISLIGALFALLGLAAFWAGRQLWHRQKYKLQEEAPLTGPGFLALPQGQPELFSAEKLLALSKGLTYQKPESAQEPHYLVLIERQSAEDLFASLMEKLWSSLRQAGVQLDFFFFQDHPGFFIDPDSGQYKPLSSLAKTHESAQLILCTDGACMIDPYQKGFASSIAELLLPWAGRKYVFTPIPLEDWEEIESYLTREFVLCPASQPLTLPVCIQTGQYQPATESRAAQPGWKKGLAYSTSGLQRYLGDSLFLWLQMTALWPHLSSSWAMQLARLFKPDDENFTYSSLIRLSRLSWMREGGLPPSLAYRWIASLPPAAERGARELLLQCLQETVPPMGSVAEREKRRMIALQQFMLQPEKLPYAKAIYPLLSQHNWNKTARRLIHLKRKALQGKSLGEYLKVRLGRMRMLLGAAATGLITALIAVLALHAGWQLKSHDGGGELLADKSPNSIWHVVVWEENEGNEGNEGIVEKEEGLGMEEKAEAERADSERVETKLVEAKKVEVDTVVAEALDESTFPCEERDKLLFQIKGRGISGNLWMDKEVVKDANRLQAYARDNGVELGVTEGFPSSQGGTDFSQKMAIGRAFICTLRYRKGLDWVACNGACLSNADGQPRPVRKFLEDLTADRWWKWEMSSDGESLQIWLDRYLPAEEARERAFRFAEYWEVCGE